MFHVSSELVGQDMRYLDKVCCMKRQEMQPKGANALVGADEERRCNALNQLL